MKPFTLEWWLDKLELTTGALINALQAGDMDAYDRYREEWYWIRNRITKKYGEQ